MSGPGDPLLLFSILIFSGLALSILTFELVLRRVDIFDPVVLFTAFYALFVLPLPIRAYITDRVEGNITPYLNNLYPFLSLAVLLSALGLLVLVVVYHSPIVPVLAGRIPLPPPSSPRGSSCAFWFLIFLSGFLIALLSYSVGGLDVLLSKGYEASAELFGRGYLAIGFPWGFVASLFLLLHYALKPRLRYLLGFGILFALMVFIQLIMGNRSLILTATLATLIFVHYAIRKFRSWEFLTLAAMAFLGLNLYGFLRSSDYEGIGGFLTKTHEQFVQLLESNELSKSLFYTVTIGEFVVPFETLPQMIRTVGGEINPLWGLSFVRAPLYYIPSAIFSERPLPLANWYMQEFYGTEFGLNEGRQFFILAEGYLNFGVAGVFVVMVIWGIFLGLLREFKARARGEPGALLLYSVTLAFIFRAVAGDFASLVVGLPSQNLFPALLGVLIATRFRRWRRVRKRELASLHPKGGEAS
ncbi:MAG: O-antigen polysaccharide polymerase Wzy [Candidatus Bipolaricaulaceae bacterium]